MAALESGALSPAMTASTPDRTTSPTQMMIDHLTHFFALSADACASAYWPCAHNPLTWLDLTMAMMPVIGMQNSVTRMADTRWLFGICAAGGCGGYPGAGWCVNGFSSHEGLAGGKRCNHTRDPLRRHHERADPRADPARQNPLVQPESGKHLVAAGATWFADPPVRRGSARNMPNAR